MNDIHDVATYNASFGDRLASEGTEKMSMELGALCKDKILESSIVENFLEVKDVNRGTPGVQEDDVTDTLYLLVHSERLTTAMSGVLRGNGTARIFRSKKFKITFSRIETEHFVTDDAQIAALSYPFTDDIEKKFPVALSFVQDREMLLHFETMCQTQQAWANPNLNPVQRKLCTSNLDNVVEGGIVKGDQARNAAQDTFGLTFLQKADLVRIRQLFPGRSGESMRPDKLLLTETDLDGLINLQNEDLGTELVGEVVQNGWKRNRPLGNFQLHVTNQTSLLRPGNLYATAGKDFGGLFVRFIDTKMALDRRGDRLEMWAWKMAGMGFGNVRYCKKIELYSASVTPGATDTGYEGLLPMSEETMLRENIPDYETTAASFEPEWY